jgi:YD repeat-containing protein
MRNARRTYGYDANGNRTSMTDGTGATTYARDERDQLTSVTTPGPTVVRYRYDLDGNRTKLIYRTPRPSTTFDKAGRMSGLTDWASRTVGFAYFPDGALQTATNPNGTVASYAYNNDRRATGITDKLGTTTLADHAYTLDPGQRDRPHRGRQQLDLHARPAVTPDRGQRARRAPELATTRPATGPQDLRRNDELHVRPRRSDDRRRSELGHRPRRGALTARGSDTFGTTRPTGSPARPWPGSPRPTPTTATARFSRQVAGGPLIRSVTDPNQSLPVTIADGTRKYVWGQGLAYNVAGTALEVYHADRLRSVRLLTNGAGTVTATSRFDEWGIPTSSTGSSSQPTASPASHAMRRV